jgi:hypothetical protein
VIDPATGEAHAMKLFVATMGASNFTYAEAVASEGLEDWICALSRLTWNAARAGAGRLPLSKVMESTRLSGSYPTQVPGKVGRLTGSRPNAVSPTSAPPEASSIRTRSASHGEGKETEREISVDFHPELTRVGV